MPGRRSYSKQTSNRMGTFVEHFVPSDRAFDLVREGSASLPVNYKFILRICQMYDVLSRVGTPSWGWLKRDKPILKNCWDGHENGTAKTSTMVSTSS